MVFAASKGHVPKRNPSVRQDAAVNGSAESGKPAGLARSFSELKRERYATMTPTVQIGSEECNSFSRHTTLHVFPSS